VEARFNVFGALAREATFLVHRSLSDDRIRAAFDIL
jgi:hypothetical protein